MAVMKRLIIVLIVLAVPLAIGLLFTFDIIDINWVSGMEIQPSFRANENPLPMPGRSVPVQGAGYVAELGPPENPVEATEESIQIGQRLYVVHCALCHGTEGDGQGSFAAYLQNPPGDLTGQAARDLSDGAIFLVITHGVEGRMPAMTENIPQIENRWHVVNYVRQLQAGGQ